MVETGERDRTVSFAFSAERVETARAFHRELNDMAREIYTRILKETKSRSHKQVMHYAKRFEGEQRVDLMMALSQIYTVRARSRRRYIAPNMILERIRDTRMYLPVLARFFKSVEKDLQTVDTHLAALEGGLMLLCDDI